jgi:hypothetical protein
MLRQIGAAVVVAYLLSAPHAFAQGDAWAGSWRGPLSTAGDGAETQVTLTLIGEGGRYSGLLTGFAVGSEIRLSSIETDDVQLTVSGSTDSAFGPLAFVYSLTRGERPRASGRGTEQVLSGGGRVTLGGHGFDVELELSRARRADVPQPQVERRIGYFVGTWTFDYTGGEFPPLSIGTRTGQVTFTALRDAPFVRGAVDGDAFGDAYSETWTIGFDGDAQSVVWQEQPDTGETRLGLGDWSSPIAIRLQTAPIESQGSTYVMRRLVGVTSEASFSVTDEFSVDGGAFRRLGNGAFIRAN